MEEHEFRQSHMGIPPMRAPIPVCSPWYSSYDLPCKKTITLILVILVLCILIAWMYFSENTTPTSSTPVNQLQQENFMFQQRVLQLQQNVDQLTKRHESLEHLLQKYMPQPQQQPQQQPTATPLEKMMASSDEL